MQVKPEIDFRDIDHSDAIEEHIKEKVMKLEQHTQSIIACHVTLEHTQKSKSQGKLFKVTFIIEVPGKEIVASQDDREDLYISIRDAFRKAVRQLDDYNDIMNGQIKHHKQQHTGVIARLFEEDTYGFIEDQDDEYYFHANNVVHPNFSKLKIGDIVSFLKHIGDEGLQAHRVKLSKHVEDIKEAS